MISKIITLITTTFFSLIKNTLCIFDKNWLGVVTYPPGHYYSPLLNITEALKRDGKRFWKNIRIDRTRLRNFYSELSQENRKFKRFVPNNMFPMVDAILVLRIIELKKPERVIEVGSGFSTLAFLDAFEANQSKTRLTCIEPFPNRLKNNVALHELKRIELIQKPLQDVPLQEFKNLKQNDILFVDSSHVAKIGSDVTYLFLVILPELASGVIIHFHDIVYPYTYPKHWTEQGWAWNESLFLRAFLVESYKYEIIAFNSYFNASFPNMEAKVFSEAEIKSGGTGGSIWLVKQNEKTANNSF
jgi:predicted O-methyltransferase YrrM